MAAEAGDEQMRDVHKGMGDASANEVEAGSDATYGGPSATDTALTGRSGEDLQRKPDAGTDGEETSTPKPDVEAETEGESGEEAADDSASSAPTAPDNVEGVEDGLMAIPESMSDLFSGSNTAELQTPRGTANAQLDPSSPRHEAQNPQPVAASAGVEPASFEQSERQSEASEDLSSQQHSERVDALQTREAPMVDDAARSSGSVSTATVFEVPVVPETPGETRDIVDIQCAAPSPTSAVPEFSWNDILRVQNLIEQCLQQYLTKREILDALKAQANIDPAFADVVWQKLEEQNPSFFRAYHIQLRLKEQVVAFNYLVTQQKEMSAKPAKRRHVKTSGAGPGSNKRRRANSSSALSPPSGIGAADPLFPSAEEGSESGDAMSASTAHSLIGQLVPPSPLPLPSPIKTELDTHSFFT